jgi:hypothetical protein
VRWQELAIRSTLIFGLLTAIIFDVTVWIAAPLGLVAIAATAELAVRPYAANAVDRLLLSCGAVVTALILAGLVLNLAPWGLSRATWAITWTVLSIGVLAWRKGLRTRIRGRTARVGSFSPWIFSASLIVVAAAILALVGVRYWNRQPALAFTFVNASANEVTVAIDATSVTERYRIVAISNVSGARRYSSAPLAMRPGENGIHVIERVPVNVSGIWMIGLESIDNDAIVRRLIINLHPR